jgi:hypothetical protein
VIRSRATAALAACVVAVLPTAGCYQGFDETVNSQPPTGNGTALVVGDLKVQDTTIVASPTDSGRAALVLTVINEGETDDALTGVRVAGTSATIRTAPLAVRSGQVVQVGGESEHQIIVTGLGTPAGSYAEVEMTFRNAGSTVTDVAIVPAVGYYEGYGPAAAVAEIATS